jgi:hypothetical protein
MPKLSHRGIVMNEKLLELDALSLTKYWLMSNAKIREVLDHDAKSLHDAELRTTDTATSKSVTADTTNSHATREG